MWKEIASRPRTLIIGAFLMSVIAVGALFGTDIFSLVSAHGDDPTLVHSCVNNGSGTIKIVIPDEDCGNNEISLDWNTDVTDTDD